ncbi:hypothetical protein Ocin01_12249 [Orchesella cincta]|uniref:Uncharacterized protein n=1 Tax=Orchesella cincta TaxID=48709 RepID=A0A1D2MMZ9_ORCCI|nr:hypothetical protein Ocin01_12249 [Orchesella cincta]
MTAVYSVSREIKKATDKSGQPQANDYGGCFYTVAFTTDREIQLLGLKFYGPAKQNVGTYLVDYKIVKTVEVENEYPGLVAWIGESFLTLLNYLNVWDIFGPGPYVREVQLFQPKSRVTIPMVAKGETFTVQFPRPVVITPNELTEIKFELVGPKTEYGVVRYDPIVVPLKDESHVTFNFLRGSCQLPEVLFTV